MKYIRYTLYAILIAISLIMFNLWQKEHPVAQPQVTTTSSTEESVVRKQSQVIQLTNQKLKTPETQLVTVKTDVLDLKINNFGNIIEAHLLKYPAELKSPTPYLLLNDKSDTFYITQSGLTESDEISPDQYLDQYTTSQKEFSLLPNQKQLDVTLKAHDPYISIVKTYTFKPGQYQMDVQYQVTNRSGKPWTGNYYMQLVRNGSVTPKRSLFIAPTFTGVALYSPENRYQHFNVSKLQENPIDQNIRGGWVAMPEHYFISAWVPDTDSLYHYYSQVTANGMYTAGMIGHKMTIKPGETVTLHSTLYVGPKVESYLNQVAPFLSHTIDYGWLWFISILLFKAMSFINRFVGNWGWTIVIITVLIKLVFYKLSESSYVSMANMKKLQPKLQQLRETYGNDKQAMSRAMMELYRKEKINPLGGCLPILIQIPVFIALYYVLLESVELRQAPFMFWIHDLSIKDPYYILPILMGISMFIQQKLSPAPPDPAQAKMMLFLPLFMTILFLNFPAGLVLYWFVNNALSILQQWYITYKFEHGGYKKK